MSNLRPSKIYPHQSKLADKFSGNWRNYIDISHSYNETEQAFFATYLSKFVNDSPEFCDLLRRSQTLYNTHNLSGEAKRNRRLLIRPPIESDYHDFGSNIFTREIIFDLQNNEQSYYLLENGEKNLNTFQRKILALVMQTVDPEYLRLKLHSHIFAPSFKKLLSTKFPP